ncbi:DUF6407 family protein [Alkalihalobacterium alkalinitrilicum]|nr:DUF6407 family protein [Alkalihalobacterium alkalinitrilicum]
MEYTNQGTIEYLHLHSMAEENLLSKVVTHAINDEINLTIEDHIIRRH